LEFGPLRVLLVEDDEDDYVLIRDLLAEIEGLALEWVDDYDEALRRLERDAHDVCLVDYRLGERSGLKLMREASSMGHRAPMILLTGMGDRKVDLEAMRAGAADYLLKGEIDAPTLERSIRYAFARRLRSLGESERRFRSLVGQVMAAQEEERKRVAYEVHDGLAQTAAAAHHLLLAFARRYSPGSDEDRRLLDRSLQLVQQTVGEARQVIADLRPTVLDDFGLATAVRQQVERLEGEGRTVEYEESLDGERLPTAMETALYRVAQEALANVRKHAGEDVRVRVSLRRGAGSVSLSVRDWGQGFRSAGAGTYQARRRVEPGERVGLSSMRERISLLGGTFSITSEPGLGTEVSANIPLTPEDETDGE
jgi:signal transduction histidine kinase